MPASQRTTGAPARRAGLRAELLAAHPELLKPGLPEAPVARVLARTLDELGRANEALPRWRRFLELATVDSPWTAEARQRLGESLQPN